MTLVKLSSDGDDERERQREFDDARDAVERLVDQRPLPPKTRGIPPRRYSAQQRALTSHRPATGRGVWFGPPFVGGIGGLIRARMVLTGGAPYGLFPALLPRPQACSVPSTGARMDGRPNGDIRPWHRNPAQPSKIPTSTRSSGFPFRYSTNAPAFGSDVVAETLRALDIPYIALNPGASYRGLHDSLVNFLGNAQPQMLLCLHEEHAVAIAHGYAKVTGKAMAAARALQRRAVPRHHGDLQRLVRPHADADARRDRPGRRDEAPAVDRLDPHRARPGRDRPRLHQVGRPAGLAGRRARVAAARLVARQHRAVRPGLHQSRRRDAGGASSPSRCRRSTPRALHAAGGHRARGRLVKQAVDIADRGEEAR